MYSDLTKKIQKPEDKPIDERIEFLIIKPTRKPSNIFQMIYRIFETKTAND